MDLKFRHLGKGIANEWVDLTLYKFQFPLKFIYKSNKILIKISRKFSLKLLQGWQTSSPLLGSLTVPNNKLT